MKIIAGSFILAASVSIANAQETPGSAERALKVSAEVRASTPFSALKNSPFSADENNESVQTLADGNRIVRSSTGKIYRNSEGRVRRDLSGGVNGMMGSLYFVGDGVSIVDPAAGQTYLLNSQAATATLLDSARTKLSITSASPKVSTEEARVLTEKLRSELAERAAKTPGFPAAPDRFGSTITSSGNQGGVSLAFANSANQAKYETRTEELGARYFEGVSADGTRKITTIPVGAIGNERPIELVYERWYSKDLGMVVFSKNSDPRFGDQTYTLSNIVQSEPDPALFSLPSRYIKSGDPATIYRINTTKPAPVTKSTFSTNPVADTAGVKARP